MSNFFIHQITLYHLEDDIVTRQQYEKVYFRKGTGIKDFAKGVMTDSDGSITIPTKEPLNITEGDYVIEGLIDDEYNLRSLTSKYTVYKVLKVYDYRKGKLQHYRLEVQD